MAQRKFNIAAIEAEENLLIDVQFLLQQLLTDRRISRSQLAKRAGISTARLSQIFAPEANPTLKSCARLFHALGEELAVDVKERVGARSAPATDWRFELNDEELNGRDDSKNAGLVAAVVKETITSNDNYRNQVEIWDNYRNQVEIGPGDASNEYLAA